MKKKLLLGVMALTLLLTSCGQPAASPTPTTTLAQELKVQADDVTLHVRIAGDPKAEDVLIAIHGGPGNSIDYMLSLEQLASAEFAVVNYDQRGTGQSTEPSNGYAMPNYVADLEAVRQAISAEAAGASKSVHLLGHSWGGLVAIRYAAAHPQRVSSIMLMGSGVLTPEADQAGQRNKAQRVAALQEQGIIPQPITSLADILPAYFSDPNFDMPHELKNMHYNPTVEQMTWAALGDYDFAASLDRLDHPVLVLWGEDDPFGLVYVEATERALSAATVEIAVIEKCGHYWHECPNEFFSHVRAFLKLPPAP